MFLRLKEGETFLIQKNNQPSCSKDSNQGDKQQKSLESLFSTNDTTKAEIIWILKCVMGGCSFRFNDDMSQKFQAMFPELEILNKFGLGRTKSMYAVKHGLAPHFKELLNSNLQKSEIFSYSFDESLNEATQTSEMDLYIRFWDDLDDSVKVRYYDSSFLGHGKHTDILNHFNELTKNLKSECLYQISMDGPNVNLKFFQEFSAKFKVENYHSLVDIGSCSLHIVHGAFRTGAEKSEWSLKKLLKGAYTILHNTPARREDFESVTGSSTYPLSFCSTR